MQYSYNMTSCNTLRRQQQSRVIGQIVVWLHKSIRVWHRLMFGAGMRREPKTLLGLSNCEIVCRTACLCVCVCHSVCVLCCCCCCCRTLQQHFRRKAVNLSNVCTLSPYRQTRQLPPSLHCATRQGRHTPRGPTHWTGVFWKTHYALRHFRGEPPYRGEEESEGSKGTVSLSVKFSKQCAIRAVMRFPQERESARRASSAFSAAFYERRKTSGERENERDTKRELWEAGC